MGGNINEERVGETVDGPGIFFFLVQGRCLVGTCGPCYKKVPNICRWLCALTVRDMLVWLAGTWHQGDLSCPTWHIIRNQ